MGLNYNSQDTNALIGTKTAAGVRTGVALTARYQHLSATSSLRQKTFAVGGFSKVELHGCYTAGISETSNTMELKVETSPDNVNWYRTLTETVSGGTSTLALREFTIAQTTTYGNLQYDGQTGNFAAGLVLTGGTSSATAVIESDTDSGATGTLLLSNISGTFQNNEVATDSATGSADVNLVLQSITNFALPLDVSAKYMRVSAKETGVASNFGNLYLEVTASGL